MKKNISVIILTRDEEINLRKCLESVSGLAQEIIIVDSGSVDGTVRVAHEFGAQVFVHPFRNQAEQFNWALENTNPSGDWIFRLDADEEILPALKNEVLEIIETASSDISGFYIKRRNYFAGKWIRYGGYYPVWLLRLFRKGTAKSEAREMDEHIILLEGRAEKLKNDFIDNNLKGLDEWKKKHRAYAAREARSFFSEENDVNIGYQAGKKRWIKKNIYYHIPPFLRVVVYFLIRYFVLLGFLDGYAGFRFHFLQGFWYRWLVDREIMKLKKERRLELPKR